MSLIIESLAEICRTHVLTEKWLIAPSLRAGYQWLDSVARAGQPVVNAHVQTVGGLSIKLSKPRLRKKGLSRLTSQGAIILVDQILNRLVEQAPGYFTGSKPSLPLSQKIFYSIRDLRLAGLDQSAVIPSLFEALDKGQEITRILELYAKELADLKLADYADEIDLARESLSDSPSALDGDVLVVLPEDIDAGLTLKEKQLLESIPTKKKVALRVDSLESLPQDRPLDNAVLLRWIREPSKAPNALPNDRAVSIFNAVGEVNEIREVFRRCLAKKIPLDEVELLYTDRNAYVPLIYDLSARMNHEFGSREGVVATFDEGIPATYSRPGKALAGWSSWIREDFLQSTFVRILEEDVLKLPGEPTDVQRLLAVKLMRSVPIGFGEDRYLPLLEGLVKRYGSKLKKASQDDQSEAGDRTALQDKVDAVRALYGMVKLLLGLVVPQRLGSPRNTPSVVADAKKADQIDVLKSARRFLELFVRTDGRLDEAARQDLLNHLRDMESIVRQWGPLNIDMMKWVGSIPQEVRILGSGPRPGAIYATNLENGGHSGRKHTFIVGLDDGRFPSAGMQDPVILDSEREALRLPTTKEGLTLQLQKFSHLLSRLSGTVTLSYSCRSIADDREMFPSPVLLSAYRIVSQNRTADINDLVVSLRPPISFTPSEHGKCLDMNEWWLSKLCVPGSVVDSDRLLISHFPHLAKGKEAARLRATAEFTIYDGHINSPDNSLDPAQDIGPRLSVNRLEKLGSCPRHYFFSHVLGIEPPEDVSVDKSVWLDNAEFGTLVHDVFYEFVSQRLNDNWPPDLSRDLDDLLDIAKNKAKRQRIEIPPPSEAAYDQQLEQLLQACKTFLSHQSKQQDTKPLFLEATIGLRRSHGQGTSLDTPDEIIFNLPGGKKIRMGGRIDRIDKVQATSPEEYVICDYKSGSAYKYRSKDIFDCGRSIQHGIYVHLVEQALNKEFPGSRVNQFTYFFPGVKEDGLLIEYGPHQLSEIMNVLEMLCSIAAKGAFINSDQPRDCKYCPYPEICGNKDAAAAQSFAKLANPNEPKLRDMRELRKREPKKSK